ncbi:MAG: hypothetical protein DSM106950_15875 [Stigonema ocellatum SAG 48.90 = DSM 106950]|nr:hypothetical protein [Stigonema ocellatum SAG 48.90 = DSM 106950]
MNFREASGHPDGKQRDLAVVISNNNPNNVRPSRPLADNAIILHHNSQTGKWSIWDTRANKGQGGWIPMTDELAAYTLGGKIPQQ